MATGDGWSVESLDPPRSSSTSTSWMPTSAAASIVSRDPVGQASARTERDGNRFGQLELSAADPDGDVAQGFVPGRVENWAARVTGMVDYSPLLTRIAARTQIDERTLPLPAPLPQSAIDVAEERLGFGLHPLLAAVYREVANGGFGPDFQLLSLIDGPTD
jgi:hypothetical protein